ncbi:hypothetical protein HYU14_07420 [Candidatus Woesearchaeota archaeon]|nr:hypothetical protein [Candidatus Woesearchaeota archaeon]
MKDTMENTLKDTVKDTMQDRMPSLLVRMFNDSPSVKIIDFLIEHKGIDFSKKQVTEGAGISKASLFNAWGFLEKNLIVRVTRKFGKTKLFTLNSASPIVKKVLDLERELIQRALEEEESVAQKSRHTTQERELLIH